jgi:hypothetical protein
MSKNLSCQNDQSNGPDYASKKNHPIHNGHVEIGYFFSRFASKKVPSFLVVIFIVMTFLVRECYGSPKKQEF